MRFTTTDHIPGQEITALCGFCATEQIVSINVIKDTLNWVKGIMGAKMDAYSKEYAKARNQALEELQSQASAYEADALIDLKLDFNEFVNADLIIVVCAASAMAVQSCDAK